MRTLRITLEETNSDKGTCRRAERAFSMMMLRRYRGNSLLALIVEELEKDLNKEIEKHECTRGTPGEGQ
jgi:hypothetical protein